MTPRVLLQEALDALRVDVDALGMMAERAARDAVTALVTDDRELARSVTQGDDRVDQLFLALEQRAYAVIAQQAPVAADLRFLMSALRVMADYEKTGDRAVALAKAVLVDWPRDPKVVAQLGRMGELALDLLGCARRAWLEPDMALACDLKRRDDALDHAYRELTSFFLACEGPGASRLVLHGHSAARNLERIADHAVIIGERVSYLLTGDPSSLAAEIA